uniref:Reverse transcriptase Ty1/copia-type domain-containing protein n=1 Tax=Tanacetum cinerariifolium TaxID=118510 RepID=A0A699JE29_TANCI|nr:hypothetical protein [Tanacetum cinerariifolium]
MVFSSAVLTVSANIYILGFVASCRLVCCAWMDFHELEITGDLLSIGVHIDEVGRMCAYLTDQHSKRMTLLLHVPVKKVYRIRKALYGLKQAPRACRFEMSLMEEMKFFLEFQIHQSSRGIFINRAKYTLEILKKHVMEKYDTVGIPMATKPKLDADLSGKLIDQTDYRSKIGSLMYLTSSRPGIVQADSSFELTAFLDTDHAGCIDTRKSTSGGIQFLCDKLVCWMLKKHDCTAMSSAEAEYMALSAAIAISCNPVQHSRTKHIHTRCHFIKEQIENGIIELYFVRTEYQLADMFTKASPEDRFQYLVRRIGMRRLTPASGN